eukprot:SAG31_NODE_362_length_16904_cov_7.893218_9_plen_263_part_00
MRADSIATEGLRILFTRSLSSQQAERRARFVPDAYRGSAPRRRCIGNHDPGLKAKSSHLLFLLQRHGNKTGERLSMGLGPPERLTVLVGMALVALVMGLPLDTYVSWMITSCWPAILGSCTPYLGHTLSVVGTAVALLAAVVWLLGVDLGWVLAYTVTNHRWVLACILMPISVVFDGFMNLRVKLVFMLGSAPDQHEKRVAEVSRQVLDWRETGAPQGQKMCTARPGWLTMSLRVGKYKATHRNIKVELRCASRLLARMLQF